MTTRMTALVAGAIGIVLPLILLAVDAASVHGWWPKWIVYVWPTSYMLGATAGEKDLAAYLIITAAVAVNSLVYAYLGFVIARLMRRADKKTGEP